MNPANFNRICKFLKRISQLSSQQVQKYYLADIVHRAPFHIVQGDPVINIPITHCHNNLMKSR